MALLPSLENYLIPPPLRAGYTPPAQHPILDLKFILLTSIQYYLGLVTTFSAIISFVYIVYAGYLMFTAFGDESKYTTGKKTLIYAMIGFAISLLAKVIILLFANTLGYSGASPF